ncbi:hypothetical protein [Roseivirga echinicomitans]|uniref:Uncharacterized protein n=1 Tax=Roseivirga echinicomitans TaxID=296218 RepID=A0A150X1V1_9BACT|nr:hypothetical protein [Roseivirga echinicomitans]KYG72707.1 hypothetical protein AWN68_08345 [Roseivirga echinicomitans]
MEFQLYKRHKQVLKNSIATFFFLVVGLTIAMMSRGIGVTESSFSEWNVPVYGYVLAILGIFVLGTLGILVQEAKSTSHKVLFEDHSIQLKRSKERVSVSDVISVKRDYHQWTTNDEDGNVWILKIKNKKEVKFLVERRFDDDLKKWINENDEFMKTKV